MSMTPERRSELRHYFAGIAIGTFILLVGTVSCIHELDVWSALLVASAGIWYAAALLVHDRMKTPPRWRELF